jgi:uncharacterized protein DUF4154
LKYSYSKYYKFVSLLILTFILSANLFSQKFTEYEVKSAYLFNFTKFVEWPQSAFKNDDSPYIIGIYKNDGFGVVLNNTIRGRIVNGRKVIIKYFNNPQEIKDCHILFFPKISKSELINVNRAIDRKPILTVGNGIEGFCETGGVINFSQQYSRYRFEINNDIALKARIKISSKLLVLAKIISEDEIKF